VIGEIFSLIRVPVAAFLGGFLVVGGWIWAPQISSLMPGLSSAVSSLGLGGSWFADARLGRAETAPVIRNCIFRILDVGREMKMEPSAAYLVLKAGSIHASLSTLLGKAGAKTEDLTFVMASKWGEMATCIYAQDDRELCDPDNRAAMVEASTKFFAYAKQTEASKPAISPSDASVIEGFSDRLLIALKNHRGYGTLVAADFGSFAAPEIARIMREDKETRDICKR
jgi:hypothetical protein